MSATVKPSDLECARDCGGISIARAAQIIANHRVHETNNIRGIAEGWKSRCAELEQEVAALRSQRSEPIAETPAYSSSDAATKLSLSFLGIFVAGMVMIAGGLWPHYRVAVVAIGIVVGFGAPAMFAAIWRSRK